MTLKIVDVSSHQGNYIVGSNGEDGIIIKATQGTGYVNPNLDFVAQQAISKNLPWAIYHYAGGGDAINEADTFLNASDKYLKGNNPPNLILDWEEYQNNAYGNGSWAETFLNRVKEKTGLQSGIYGNSNDMAQMPDSVTQSAWLWFAGYPSSNDVGWNPIAFPYSIGKFPVLTGWQFSSTPLDKSLFYLSVDEWKQLGKNQSNNNINNLTGDEDMKPYLFNVQDEKGNITGGTFYFDGTKTIAFAGSKGKLALDHISGTYEQINGEKLKTQTKTKAQFDLWEQIYPASYINFK